MILDQMLKNKALSRTISSVGVGKYELLSGGAECGNRKEATAACIFRIHHRRPWSMLIPNKKFREMLIMKILSLHGPKFDTKRMALAAMLIALQIILEKLSIGDPAVLKIGLGFIATALIGFLLGPWIGALSMIINDLISNMLLSSGAMFFPGFTLSAAISGIIAGMFLYQQQINWRRILIYEFCQILITNVFFTTLWLYLMGIGQGSSAMPFMALLMVRLPKEVISWPIEALIVLTLLKAVERAGLKTTFD